MPTRCRAVGRKSRPGQIPWEQVSRPTAGWWPRQERRSTHESRYPFVWQWPEDGFGRMQGPPALDFVRRLAWSIFLGTSRSPASDEAAVEPIEVADKGFMTGMGAHALSCAAPDALQAGMSCTLDWTEIDSVEPSA